MSEHDNTEAAEARMRAARARLFELTQERERLVHLRLLTVQGLHDVNTKIDAAREDFQAAREELKTLLDEGEAQPAVEPE